ncbi:MAG: hypothetical protein Q4E47_02015 [Candidatus Saccharibacteria bacterium]|nr:hypothetical protein [Candidatus Saccharibacteria bacterium]
MIISDVLIWWYTRGLSQFVLKLIEKAKDLLSFFSIGSLIRTLFAPFRQISAGESGNSLQDRFHAWGDRLVSRCIGAVVRIFLMIAGLIAFILEVAISVVLTAFWLILPTLPILCIILIAVGVKL